MKKLLLIPTLSLLSLHADLSIQQIQNMVIKIHQKRKGLDLAVLEQTKEPFLINSVIEGNSTNLSDSMPTILEEEAKLSLHAIMNGRAYINDEWKSVGEKVLGYTLEYIGKRGVVLKNGNQIKTLFLHKKRDDFMKIVEKGE